MLDVKYIRDNLSEVKKALAKKEARFDIDGLIKLDDARQSAKLEAEKLRSERNRAAQAKDHKKGKLIKEALKKAEAKLAQAEHNFYDAMAKMDNIPYDSVPGKKQGNQVISQWGKPPKFNFKPKNHLQIGEALDIIDVKRAAKISGARFGILKNQAVDLQFGLINYVFEKLAKKGFVKLIPPVLVREQAMWGSGFFPAEKNEYYKTDRDDLYLSGTAEVPMASLHSGETLTIQELPIKYAGFSSAFRREAGSYGKDTRGIFRVHQFDKIEMFVYCDPKKSWEEFERLADITKEILQELKLPYQQLNMHAGELGAPNAKKFDFEVWFPSYSAYRELMSCSHDTDFQARRLNVKTEKGEYVHTLNNTAIALGRTIAAIIENYQQKDGSVAVPEVLNKFLPLKKIEK